MNGGFISTTSTLSAGRPAGRKDLGAGCNVHRDDLGRDGICGGVAARQSREIGIDLDQNQLYPADAPGDREAGRADASADRPRDRLNAPVSTSKSSMASWPAR